MGSQSSGGSKWLSRLFFGGVTALGIGLLCIPFLPVGHSPCSRPDPPFNCAMNLHHLGTAFMMYVQDYDEHFPPLSEWHRRTEMYVRRRKSFYCYSVLPESSYAAFSPLSRRPLAQIWTVSETPILYDSVRTQPSPYDQLLSLPEPERHNGRNSVAYADGNVKKMRNYEVHKQGCQVFLTLIGDTPQQRKAQRSKQRL